MEFVFDYCFILMRDRLIFILFYFVHIFENFYFLLYRLLPDYWSNLKGGKNSNMDAIIVFEEV